MKEPVIQKLDVLETLETNYMPYAMSVIISRALPEIDGLKPSHRKLLYTMYGMGLLKGNLTKSANIVGQTMKIHPHGDMAIYETMVRMTKGNESLLMPLVESKGNFGRCYSRDMAFASPRYTEAKLMPVASEFFQAINKDTVPFVPNYDNTSKEPVLLPVTFPSILANPNQGIAVGMASNICSFNLTELCDATIAFLEDKQEEVFSLLKAPDFSTGAELLYDKQELERIYRTGHGSFSLRAVYQYNKEDHCIEIIEIPYTTTLEAIMEKMVALMKAGKLKEVNDIRDETDLKGLKLTLDLKRNTDPKQLMTRLFRQTSLQDTFSCNFNLIVNGHPKVLGVLEILKEWLFFRQDCLKRQFAYEKTEQEKTLHLLKGLEKILLDIDKAIQIIRETQKEKEVVPNLMTAFTIDEVQAEYIAEIKLRHLNREYLLKQTKQLKSLRESIADLEALIESPERQKAYIINDLKRVRDHHGQPRRTKIIDREDIPQASPAVMISHYKLKVFLTRDGYLKKIPSTSLRGNFDHKLKPKDYIIQEIEGENKDDLILFSSAQKAYKLKLYEIEDLKTSDLGLYLPNLVPAEPDEKMLYMVTTSDYAGHMLFAYENGKMAKIPLSAYETKTNRKVLANAFASQPLRGIRFLEQDETLLAVSSINKVLVFNTSQINSKATRHSLGVQVLKSKKNSELIAMLTLEQVQLEDPDYYHANVPAVGSYLKKTDSLSLAERVEASENISLLELLPGSEENMDT
ncbi:DNA gyrase/topoisomerase IV subunit A [Tindallia californiensis]|uniref:DNA gyrase subunit A n=1 Tax=Tindallia californiensis TaxID=159292 RepID=A0A1H3MLE7_9FIRM|nr:DNA topoisomerase (ATP-hydrolyzing) subunit A [Tindallia californiensis]SDY77552.1 DNA gyrase subunit A [Tindallia californiensis]